METMPLQLTHKNHFKYGYNSIPFSRRKSNECHWWVEYGKASRKPLNFKDECIRTARLIRQNTQKPIFVLFSGGVDSEVTVRSFVDADIEITAAILKFKDNLNLHDISYAVKTCEELKIPYKFFELDIVKFWEEAADQYAHATQCFSPQLISTMYLMDQIEGYCVLGGGECLLVKDNETWSLLEKERIASWYRYFENRQKEGCAGFFQYSPELMLAYLEDEFVINSLENYNNSSLFKLEFYQKHFPLISRPKFTGFEKLQDEDHNLREKLKKFYLSHDQVFKTTYYDLVKKLSPSLS